MMVTGRVHTYRVDENINLCVCIAYMQYMYSVYMLIKVFCWAR